MSDQRLRRTEIALAAILCLAVAASEAAAGDDLVWSTFLGGIDKDEGYDIAVDGAGNVWVAGMTESQDFPTTSGALDTILGDRDAVVVQLDAHGEHVLCATLLGGEGRDEAYGIAVDSAGNIYLAGYTASADFPVTAHAPDTLLGGDSDAFVVKLEPTGGAISYATFLGGSGDESGYQIAADRSGGAWIIGNTDSEDFPITSAADDQTYNGTKDAFVARLEPSGTILGYATFLGGSQAEYGWAIALDDSGHAYVAGYTYSPDFPATPGSFDSTLMGPTDVFVAKFDPSGGALRYATLLGGGSRDAARSIAVDDAGHAYVTGYTFSSDFPTTPGAFDSTNGISDISAFVTKVNHSGSALVYSTFLGGEGIDSGYGVAVDDSGNAWVVGFTEATDFPTTPGALDQTHNGQRDVFLCGLDADGARLKYGTLLGGGQGDYAWDLTLNAAEEIFFSGYTLSEDFPATAGAFQVAFGGEEDIFVARISPGGQVPVVWSSPAAGRPKTVALCQNYPNPFNAGTTIRYRLPCLGPMALRVYNAAGQMVSTLLEANQAAGEHSLVWDGRDRDGHDVTSGIYFLRLEASGAGETIKMMLVR